MKREGGCWRVDFFLEKEEEEEGEEKFKEGAKLNSEGNYTSYTYLISLGMNLIIFVTGHNDGDKLRPEMSVSR